MGLKGLTNQCRARYRVFFSGNVAIPTGGTVAPITLAIAIDGEPFPASSMITTPAAVDSYDNVASAIFVDVPRGCCMTISVSSYTMIGGVYSRDATILQHLLIGQCDAPY